jgi:hypothetical protein
MFIPTNRAFTLEEAEAYLRADAGNPAFEEEARGCAGEQYRQDYELPSVIYLRMVTHPDPNFYNRWRAAFTAGNVNFGSQEVEYAKNSSLGDIYTFGSPQYNPKALEMCGLCLTYIQIRAAELKDESWRKTAASYYGELDAFFGETLPTKEECINFQVSPQAQGLRWEVALESAMARIIEDAVTRLRPIIPEHALAQRTAILSSEVSFGTQFKFTLLTPISPELQETMIVEALTTAGLEVSADDAENGHWKLERDAYATNPIYFPDGQENIGFALRRLNLKGSEGVEEVRSCVTALLKIGATSNETCELIVGTGRDKSEREPRENGNFTEFMEADFSDPAVRRGISQETGVTLSKLAGFDENLGWERSLRVIHSLEREFRLEQVPALVANAAGFKHMLLKQGLDAAAAWLLEQNPHAAAESTGLLSAERTVRGTNPVVQGADENPGRRTAEPGPDLPSSTK